MGMNRKVLLVFILLSIFLLVTACASEPTAGDVQEIPPTVFVTVYVTPITATAAPFTPQPLPQQTQPPKPTAFDPGSPSNAPVYFPGPGCSASRIHPNDQAYVVTLGQFARVFKSKNIPFDPGVRDLVPGEEMTIIGGPYCDEDWIFWFVEMASDELQGWVPEGNGDTYYLLPLPPNAGD